MTDTQHREQVRREAIAMGWTPTLAAFLADRVDRPPTEAERAERASRFPHAALRTRASKPTTTTTADRLQRIAALFGAAALVPDFTAAGLPLRQVVEVLSEATGAARSITPAGLASVRVQMQSLQHWGAAS